MANKNFMSYTETNSPATSDNILIANRTNGVMRSSIENISKVMPDKIIALSGSVQIAVSANSYAESSEIIPTGLTGYKIIGVSLFNAVGDIIPSLRSLTDGYFRIRVRNFSNSSAEPYIYYFAICKKI